MYVAYASHQNGNVYRSSNAVVWRKFKTKCGQREIVQGEASTIREQKIPLPTSPRDSNLTGVNVIVDYLVLRVLNAFVPRMVWRLIHVVAKAP